MKKIPLFLFLVITAAVFPQPKEEVRAVWVTTVYNLDWPRTSGANTQRTEMINLLDKLKAANFNTIMLQVRGRGDMLYGSAIEPWSRALTGSLGGNPGYDPVQFTVDEAHKRGMEVHAWWNVYKVYGTGNPPNTNPQHVVLRHPELVKLYASEWWLDPGEPATKTYLLNLAMEMVRKYPLDGIHFDFIRYPGTDFNDSASYANYGGGVNKSDWRRSNINNFVSAIYDSIQLVRPEMKVGSAPIGIYKDLSTCNSGWDAYTQVFQDSRRWMLARKHDYLSPQVYWDISTCPRFDSLAIDWISGRGGRHIYMGIAAYRMATADGNWPATEILAQVDTSRKFGAQGQTFFRTASFIDNQKNLYNLIKANQYLYPANIPSMPWKDNIKPLPPENLSITTQDSLTYLLNWHKSPVASDGDTAVYYNLYMDTAFPVDTSDIKKVIVFGRRDTSFTVVFTAKPSQNHYFTVTAYDNGYNESAPSITAGIIITGITEETLPPGEFALFHNYPNPFNPETEIGFLLPEGGEVKLTVYSALGREISVLYSGFAEKGSHKVRFSAESLSSGAYYASLSYKGSVRSIKMLYLK